MTIITGSKVKDYDGNELTYNSYELSPSDPWVNDQAPEITVTGSITNAGNVDNSYEIDWNGVNKNNYNVTNNLGKLTVKPVEIVLKSDCSYQYSGDIEIEEPGLIIQVNNVEPERYSVEYTEYNEWTISFFWDEHDDTIIASTVLIKDDTSFAIIPIHEISSGDEMNYDFETEEQTGEFDKAPYIPGDGDGMGKSSNRRSIAKSLSDDLIQEETSKEEPQAAISEVSEPEEPEAPQKEFAEAPEPEEPQEEIDEAPEPEQPQEEVDEAPEPEEPQEEIDEAPEPEEPQEEIVEASEPEEPQEEEDEASEPEEVEDDDAPSPEPGQPQEEEGGTP